MNTIDRNLIERLTKYYNTLIDMNLATLPIVDDLENIVLNRMYDSYDDNEVQRISQEAVKIIYGD